MNLPGGWELIIVTISMLAIVGLVIWRLGPRRLPASPAARCFSIGELENGLRSGRVSAGPAVDAPPNNATRNTPSQGVRW